MDLIELIKTRRTVRKYKDKTVPREIIEKIVDAGRWAPSAHNLQPWRFVVVESRDKIDKIADLLNEKADALLAGFNLVMRDTAKNLRNAPLLFFVYSDGVIARKFSKFGDPYERIGDVYEIQSIATAAENMMLCAHSLKLGMAWYGMTLFCEDVINELLGQSDKLVATLSLGFPDEVPKVLSRKKTDEIVEYIL